MDIRPIPWQDTLPLRHAVLWPELPAAASRVEGDESARHYGAFVDGGLVAVASIFAEGRTARLRKFATAPAHQGQGIGSAMLAHILSGLREEGYAEFWCDARESALGFYARFGLRPEGERFFKSGVAYFRLRLPL